MPSYTVTDPASGRTVTLEGDAPPTEADLDQVFAEVHKQVGALSPRPGQQAFTRQELESQGLDVSPGGQVSKPAPGLTQALFPTASQPLPPAQPQMTYQPPGATHPATLTAHPQAPDLRGLEAIGDVGGIPTRAAGAAAGEVGYTGATGGKKGFTEAMADPGTGVLRPFREDAEREYDALLDNTRNPILRAMLHAGRFAALSGLSALEDPTTWASLGAGAVGKAAGRAAKAVPTVKNAVAGLSDVPAEVLDRAATPEGLQAIQDAARTSQGGNLQPMAEELAGRVQGLNDQRQALAEGARQTQVQQFGDALLDARRGANLETPTPGRLQDLSADAAGGRVVGALEASKPEMQQAWTQGDKATLGRLREAPSATMPVEEPAGSLAPGETGKAFSNGREIPIERDMEAPPPGAGNAPTAEDLAAYAKDRPEDAPLAGNPRYADLLDRYRREDAERARQEALSHQGLRQALKQNGPIYITDDMRRQLGITGQRWKDAAGDFGLAAFTADPKKGKSLEQIAQSIGEAQAAGDLKHLPPIQDQSDLVDALFGERASRPERPDASQSALLQAMEEGEGLPSPERVPVKSLQPGDLFTVGNSPFKVLRRTVNGVEVSGPVKTSFQDGAALHIDAGSLTRAGDTEGKRLPPVMEGEDAPPLPEGQSPVTFMVPRQKQVLPRLFDQVLQKYKALPGQGVPKISLGAQKAFNWVRDYADKTAVNVDDLLNLKSKVRNAQMQGGWEGNIFDPSTDDLAFVEMEKAIDQAVELSIRKAAPREAKDVIPLFRANQARYAQAKELLGDLYGSLGKTVNSERIIPKIRAMGPERARQLHAAAEANPVLQPVVQELRHGMLDDLLLSAVRNGEVNPEAFAKEWSNLSPAIKSVWMDPKTVSRIDQAVANAGVEVGEPGRVGTEVFGKGKTPAVGAGTRRLENIGAAPNRQALRELNFLDDILGLKGADRYSTKAQDVYQARQLGMDAKGQPSKVPMSRTGRSTYGLHLGEVLGSIFGGALGFALHHGAGAVEGGIAGGAVGRAIKAGVAYTQSPAGAILATRALNRVALSQLPARAQSIAKAMAKTTSATTLARLQAQLEQALSAE